MNPKWWLGSGVLFCLFLFPAIGTGQDNWRHQDVWLKNEAGDRITPARNSADPYSPRKTCGGCHGYLTITQGDHFQQGFDGLGKKAGGPGAGIYNKGLPPAVFPEPVAAKRNSDPRRMGLSVYDWIGAGAKVSGKKKAISAASGWYLPGGGPLEYGRNLSNIPDPSRTLSEAESASRNLLDGDYSSRFTPDGKSHFRESGVVEADCLICHQAGYRMGERNAEISRRNYRWAATAGAGLGEVKGAIFTYRNPEAGPESDAFLSGAWNFSRRPVVVYHWQNRSLFTGEGRLNGRAVQKAVPARSCLQCHQGLTALRTGTLYLPRHDAHARWGLQCTDCHPLTGKTPRERLGHQIAKDVKTCEDCHLKGQYRPNRKAMAAAAKDPRKKHGEKFPRGSFHFLLISCGGCHITAPPAKGGYLLDEGNGRPHWYTADNLEFVEGPGDFESPAAQPWKPWIMRSDRKNRTGERYVSYVPRVRQWFGEKTAGGELKPIPLFSVQQAAKRVKGTTFVEVRGTDGKKVKQPTVATPEDVAAMLKALSALGFRKAVFVADRVYELKEGKIVSSIDALRTKALPYPLHHGVVPLKSGLTYGAKGAPEGCLDCHADSAPFFTKMKITNIGSFLKNDYPVPKEPNAVMQMQEWGLNSVPSSE